MSCLASLLAASPSLAGPDDPFNAEFGFLSTEAQAGAQTDVWTGAYQRKANGCRMEQAGSTPKYLASCARSAYYSEQNLKKVVVNLPPGLLADVNATSEYCDFRREWVSFDGKNESEIMRCSLRSQVGEVGLVASQCGPPSPPGFPFANCIPDPNLQAQWPGATVLWVGRVYMERPREGEQGRLVVLVPTVDPTGGVGVPFIRTDIGVRVRDERYAREFGGPADLGVTAVADRLPDVFVVPAARPVGCTSESCVSRPKVTPAINIFFLALHLYGQTGAEQGHPLLVNPTGCERAIGSAQLQGYQRNSFDPPSVSFPPSYVQGSGVGRARDFTFDYQPTDCDRVPYEPNLELDLAGAGPSEAPAISAKVTQPAPDKALNKESGAVDQPSTKKVMTTFPKAFKVNLGNTATHCPDADLREWSCRESSRIGTVAAKSRLLQTGRKLAGGVYLAGLSGDAVKIAALLEGRVQDGAAPTHVRIDAEGKILADGRLQTVFDDLPQVPISEFELNLEGGAKGLLTTPKVCGSYTVETLLESHAGKQKAAAHTFRFSGCKKPSFDVELSNRRKGAWTDLDLTVGSVGTALRAVEFRLARQLGWGARKPRGRRGKGLSRSAARAVLTTSEGVQTIALRAKRTAKGSVALTELRQRTRSGQLEASAAPDFAATIFRTRPSRPRATANAAAKARARSRTALVLRGLPGEGLTGVELSLKGESRRSRLVLRNPASCKKPLNFVALIETRDGARLALKRQARLRGKGCRRGRRYSRTATGRSSGSSGWMSVT